MRLITVDALDLVDLHSFRSAKCAIDSCCHPQRHYSCIDAEQCCLCGAAFLNILKGQRLAGLNSSHQKLNKCENSGTHTHTISCTVS